MARKAILSFLLCLLLSVAQAAELSGKVSWVYDGDTLQIESLGQVRLLGIDTPEYQDSPRDRFYMNNFHIPPPRLRDISSRAKNYTIRQVKERTVKLAFDTERRDRHGRLLAYVYLANGEMLNLLLLEQGLATVFRRYDFSFKETFLATENAARGRKIGLWEP